MPLHVRSIAVTVAVTCFFALSFICWMSGLSTFVCCKRAITGAAIAYAAGAFSVKAINAILMNAIISSQMDQQEETGNAGKD
jgi:hypothetical protein